MKVATFFRVPSSQKRHTPLSVHRWFRILLFLPTLLLQSCLIEGEEEIWIEADGAGKIRIQYTIPNQMVKNMGNPDAYLRAIRDIDGREDGARITELSFEKVGKQSLFGGSSRFILETEFDDIQQFFELVKRNKDGFVSETGANADKLETILGDIDLEMNFSRLRAERTVSLEELLPEAVHKFPDALGQSNFSYIYHLPLPIEETNAHHISEDRKTVKWKFLLKDHVTRPLILRLETNTPLPWWFIAIITILALIVIWVLHRVIRGK